MRELRTLIVGLLAVSGGCSDPAEPQGCPPGWVADCLDLTLTECEALHPGFSERCVLPGGGSSLVALRRSKVPIGDPDARASASLGDADQRPRRSVREIIVRAWAVIDGVAAAPRHPALEPE